MFLSRKHRTRKIVKILPDSSCPKCDFKPLKITDVISKRNIMDLVSTSSGIRKTIIQYEGIQGYCRKCSRNYAPSQIRLDKKNRVYGDGIGAWLIYHRVALRLSYESIIELFFEQFKEEISISQPAKFLKQFAKHYSETEKKNIENMLKSPFIHADETKANIKGSTWYVWVFTDGKHAIFRLTETREATIAHEILEEYKGILVSDFYSGYDSIGCKQQKCWVHLIRDLNRDLQSNPFDKEFEIFLSDIRNVIVPIMETIQTYGSKRRNLHKHKKYVEKFYKETIETKRYKSDLVLVYQKRFIRYKDSLFTFLTDDFIPWHNNRRFAHFSPNLLKSLDRGFENLASFPLEFIEYKGLIRIPEPRVIMQLKEQLEVLHCSEMYLVLYKIPLPMPT